MKRREFITLLGGAVAWPLAARAQQSAKPVVAFINVGAADANARRLAAFRKGLSETGQVEGQNVIVEYHWLEGRYDRLSALMADLVRRRVAVIATPATQPAALAAKAATSSIPIVFGVGEDPVSLGLVASLARPGGNATGVNFFNEEITAKRLALLHELVPGAVRIAVLANPDGPGGTQLHGLQEAARALGLQIRLFQARTSSEIDAEFAALTREHVDCLRRFLQQPSRADHHAGCARAVTRKLCLARVRRGRRADELWDQSRGHVSSGRRLCRQHP